MKKLTKEIKQSDYYVCIRCNVDSHTKNSMIPCPRGGCEAEIKGTITTTTETKLFK